MPGIRVPLASLLVDHNRFVDATTDLLVINEIPQENETGVPLSASISMTAACMQSEVITEMQVWLADLGAGGLLELAYDLTGGGFQAGYSGSATPDASPSSGVNDELQLVINRALDFSSLSNIRVEVLAATASYKFSGAYNFTTEDKTPPEILDVVFLGPRTARVIFSEPMNQTSSLNFTFADEGVEIVDAQDVQLMTQAPVASWTGMWAGLTGSIYPSNNGYREIIAVDIEAKTVRLGSSSNPLTPDTGIDLNDAGAVIRDRKLRMSISPYRLTARLSDEAIGLEPLDPDTVQCTYEPIVVNVNAPEADEVPAGANVASYTVLQFHDDVSYGRLYTLVAKGVIDAFGNSSGDPGAEFDFTSPWFGAPTRMMVEDLIPDEYWDDDMLNQHALRSIMVVLQDLLNVLWNRIDGLQYLHDPDRCPKHLLPHLLYHMGCPFTFPVETESFQRRVANGLDQMKRMVGTETGIEDIITLLLPDVPCDVRPYLNNVDGWVLNESLLGFTTILSPGSPYYRNAYEIVSPVDLTDEQRRIVVDAAKWADPVNAHLIRVLEPSNAAYNEAVVWVLGLSALGYSTILKQGI